MCCGGFNPIQNTSMVRGHPRQVLSVHVATCFVHAPLGDLKGMFLQFVQCAVLAHVFVVPCRALFARAERMHEPAFEDWRRLAYRVGRSVVRFSSRVSMPAASLGLLPVSTRSAGSALPASGRGGNWGIPAGRRNEIWPPTRIEKAQGSRVRGVPQIISASTAL